MYKYMPSSQPGNSPHRRYALFSLTSPSSEMIRTRESADGQDHAAPAQCFVHRSPFSDEADA
jgi:hypothetical protein